jgi:hypothetical protein
LKAFVDSHLALQQSVDRARKEITDAVKAIEERNKNRSKARTPTALMTDEKNSCKGEDAAPAGGNLSLFDPNAAAASD